MTGQRNVLKQIRRRLEYTGVSVLRICFLTKVDLLLSIFAAELKQSPWVCSEAASFTYFYPAICTTEVNDYDSGVCVIRIMQFYGQRWYEGFHSDEHRSAILLQCMKSPANEIHDEVREDADNYHFGRSHTFLQPGPAAPAAAEGRDDDLLLNVCLQQQSETNFTSINHVECHNSSDWLDDFSSST
ncbi:hypothetical protein ACLB2K_052727 [Fragaria x ananassa]